MRENLTRLLIPAAVFCFSASLSPAQSPPDFKNLPIKELYDEVYKGYLNTTVNGNGLARYPIDVWDDSPYIPGEAEDFSDNAFSVVNHFGHTLNDNLGNVWPGVYESLIVQYETTGDKAYLYKFMKELSRPNGVLELKDPSTNYWYNGALILYNGRILLPMAHFVFLVYKDPTLFNTSIYSPADYGGYVTFGSFAVSVFNSVIETMDDVLTNSNFTLQGKPNKSIWSGSDTAFKSVRDIDCPLPAMLNYQAPWACALAYSYLASVYIADWSTGTPLTAYATAFLQIAQLYGSSVYDFKSNPKKCEYNSGYRDVLQVWGMHNSYYWSGFGWQPSEKLSTEPNYWEDFPHAVLDLMFPLLYNKYRDNFYNHIATDDYFNDNIMVRFKNTLSENLYIPSSNPPYFHMNTDGSDFFYQCDPSVQCQPAIMSWMPLYKFDDSPGSHSHKVYDILSDYYTSDVAVNNTAYDGNFSKYFIGLRSEGLAQITAAQWDKECYGLTLKNRDVVYDQDFYARNRLTIDPAAPNTYDPTNPKPFADPETFTDGGTQNRFVIEPGTTVNFSADGKIVGKPGFHAKAGSHARAYITPSICASGDKMGSPDGDGGKEVTKTVTEGDSTAVKATLLTAIIEGTGGTFEPELYPNPNSGVFTLKLPPGMAQQASVEIRNLLGEMIYTNPNVLQAMTEIDLSAQPKGLYYVNVISGGGVFRCAVAVQ